MSGNTAITVCHIRLLDLDGRTVSLPIGQQRLLLIVCLRHLG